MRASMKEDWGHKERSNHRRAVSHCSVFVFLSRLVQIPAVSCGHVYPVDSLQIQVLSRVQMIALVYQMAVQLSEWQRMETSFTFMF